MTRSAERAGRPSAEGVKGFERDANVGEGRTDAAEELLAGFRERHAPRRPGEEPKLETLFELPSGFTFPSASHRRMVVLLLPIAFASSANVRRSSP
jgi:hypothetical protein